LARTGKVIFGDTLLTKLLPLVLIIPLTLRLQTIFPDIHFTFDITQFTYLIVLGVATAAAFLEAQLARSEKGVEGLNIGVMLGAILFIAGLGFIAFVLITGYEYNNQDINNVISFYLFFAIFVITVQAIREIAGARKAIRVFQ